VLFADLLSLHLVTFLMFFILVLYGKGENFYTLLTVNYTLQKGMVFACDSLKSLSEAELNVHKQVKVGICYFDSYNCYQNCNC